MKQNNTKKTIALFNNHIRLIDKHFIIELKKLAKVEFYPDSNKLSTNDKIKALKNADIVIIGWDSAMLPLELLKDNHKLKYICNMTGELKRYVPIEYIQHGIKVSNWGNSLSFATAEGTIALLFSVIKDIPTLNKNLKENNGLEYRDRPIMSLYTQKVGIYGLGFIGKTVAKMLKPFNPEISFYDPTITKCPNGLNQVKSLKTLFSHNDIILINAGLNNSTRNSVDRNLLSYLKNGSILINTARGGIIVEEDLVEVLNSGKLYAGLDVINNEPHWSKSPLAKCPNIIMTGHKMSRTGALEKKILQKTALNNIKRFIDGKRIKYQINEYRFNSMT